jgi:hypothetical protein
LGLARSADNHNGLIEDQILFMSNVILTNPVDPWSQDSFLESAKLSGIDRGKTMWEIATKGSGTNYTKDPNSSFDIIIKPSVNFGSNPVELTLIATYLAGD